MTAAEILAGGARLVRTQPKAVAIWGLLYIALCIALLLILQPFFSEMMAMQAQTLAASAAGLPPPQPENFGTFFLAILLIDGILLAVLAAIFAAAVRATARIEAGERGGDRFGFLRFGMDEVRLLGLAVILFVLFFVGVLVVGMAIALAAAALAMVVGADYQTAAAAVILVLMLLLTGATIWAQVRLSLAGALTVLRGRIVLRQAWALTRGRFWTLFGVYLLFGVGYTAITILLVAIANPGLLSAYAGGSQPEAMQAVLARQQAMLADPFAPRLILTWLVGALVGTVGLAFIFGAVASAAIGFDREERA